MNLNLPTEWSEARKSLLPVLRTTSTPADLSRLAYEPVRRGVGAPFLHELVVLDRPDVRVIMTQHHLKRWRIDAESAFAAAYENLPAGDGLQQRADGLWAICSGDGYESSRLLLPGWLAAFRGRVPGEPVAVVPHARELLVGGNHDEQQMFHLLEVASQGFRTEGDPISPVPYTLVKAGLSPWRPDLERFPALAALAGAAERALEAREMKRRSTAIYQK